MADEEIERIRARGMRLAEAVAQLEDIREDGYERLAVLERDFAKVVRYLRRLGGTMAVTDENSNFITLDDLEGNYDK